MPKQSSHISLLFFLLFSNILLENKLYFSSEKSVEFIDFTEKHKIKKTLRYIIKNKNLFKVCL